MATRDRAIAFAQGAARLYGIPYVIVQSRNGQWLCETQRWADISCMTYRPEDVFKGRPDGKAEDGLGRRPGNRR